MEPIMIRKLSPALNATYNLNPGKDTTPKSKKEVEREKLLNQLYKEIFDKVKIKDIKCKKLLDVMYKNIFEQEDLQQKRSSVNQAEEQQITGHSPAPLRAT